MQQKRIFGFLFLFSHNFIACRSVLNDDPIKNSKNYKEKPLIQFDKNGKLKIVNFADLHYGEAPDTVWGPEQDVKSTKVTSKILSLETPNFVVFTGDQLTAENMYPNGTVYIDILVKPLVENNYRWASTYGNHDIGPNVARIDIFRAEEKYDLSYTAQMNDSLPGVTNYYLPIYSMEGNSTPVMIWWFLDSQGGRDKDGDQPEYIDAKVVQWFKDENANLKQLWGSLPSLVFFHIPSVEFVKMQENIPKNPLCSGLVDDRVTPQEKDTGILPVLSEVGGIKAVFVGHDHGNAWCCLYKTIQVCYNRHSGYGGYGKWVKGARVVNLDLNNLDKVTSYIRLETGEIVDNYPKIAQDVGNGAGEEATFTRNLFIFSSVSITSSLLVLFHKAVHNIL